MAIQINVSDKAAEVRKSFEPLPVGWYVVQISDVTLRFSTSAANPGKPMYGFEFTVTDDPRNPQNADGASEYLDRRLWTNACLWEGAEFTIVNILRALGQEVVPGTLDVPDITEEDGLNFFLGRELKVRQGITKKEKATAAKEGRTADPEVTSFASAEEEDAAPSSKTAVPTTTKRRVL